MRIEVALNRSEMEVPAELWLAEEGVQPHMLPRSRNNSDSRTLEGRVDESKLSALTAVRTTFHVLGPQKLYRFANSIEDFGNLCRRVPWLPPTT